MFRHLLTVCDIWQLISTALQVLGLGWVQVLSQKHWFYDADIAGSFALSN